MNCEGQSHKTVSRDHNFWRERRAEVDLNQALSAYQPNTLLLGQTGSPVNAAYVFDGSRWCWCQNLRLLFPPTILLQRKVEMCTWAQDLYYLPCTREAVECPQPSKRCKPFAALTDVRPQMSANECLDFFITSPPHPSPLFFICVIVVLQVTAAQLRELVNFYEVQRYVRVIIICRCCLEPIVLHSKLLLFFWKRTNINLHPCTCSPSKWRCHDDKTCTINKCFPGPAVIADYLPCTAVCTGSCFSGL